MTSSRVNFFLQNRKLTLETQLNLIKTSVSIIFSTNFGKNFYYLLFKMPHLCSVAVCRNTSANPITKMKKLMATAVPILKLSRNSVDETNGLKENRMKLMHKRHKRETVVEILQLRKTTFALHYTYTHQINTQQ